MHYSKVPDDICFICGSEVTGKERVYMCVFCDNLAHPSCYQEFVQSFMGQHDDMSNFVYKDNMSCHDCNDDVVRKMLRLYDCDVPQVGVLVKLLRDLDQREVDTELAVIAYLLNNKSVYHAKAYICDKTS